MLVSIWLEAKDKDEEISSFLRDKLAHFQDTGSLLVGKSISAKRRNR